ARRLRALLSGAIGPTAAEAAIAGVDAGLQLLLGRDPPEEFGELRPLRLVEGGAERLLVLARQAPDPLQRLAAGAGQVQRVGAAGGRAGPPAPHAEPLRTRG